jgi:hypothetical protein
LRVSDESKCGVVLLAAILAVRIALSLVSASATCALQVLHGFVSHLQLVVHRVQRVKVGDAVEVVVNFRKCRCNIRVASIASLASVTVSSSASSTSLASSHFV